MREFDFQIIFTPDEDGINALEPLTGTTSWGATLAEARAMIAEALELYLAETGWEQSEGQRHAVTGSLHLSMAA